MWWNATNNDVRPRHHAISEESPMTANLEKVKLLARDLRNGKTFPRSPRETLGGYVLAARAVDKCRVTAWSTAGSTSTTWKSNGSDSVRIQDGKEVWHNGDQGERPD
jgi:Domain of unknown function (DUF5069)